MNETPGVIIDTLDTPDVVSMLSNINDNINLFMFLFQFLMGVAYVFFICYVLYKFFDYCSS